MSEAHIHTGKLLALDILVKVLTNPMHDWLHMRPVFTTQLRQPLCLALLRNCSSQQDAAMEASAKILSALLSAKSLREGLKAEIGALYPLLFLRPLEADRADSQAHVTAALQGLMSICGSPQILVDVFVNYDCNLQAANLFERSMKALMKHAKHTVEGGGGASSSLALKAVLAAVKSMDTWAGPLKSIEAEEENGRRNENGEGTLHVLAQRIDDGAFESRHAESSCRHGETTQGEVIAVATTTGAPSPTTASDHHHHHSNNSLNATNSNSSSKETQEDAPMTDASGKHDDAPTTNAASAGERHPLRVPMHSDVLEKIHTDKLMKSSLQEGISLFNINPIKGLKVLVQSGVVRSDVQSIAWFLRSDKAGVELDKGAIGELFGDHHEESIQVSRSIHIEYIYVNMMEEGALFHTITIHIFCTIKYKTTLTADSACLYRPRKFHSTTNRRRPPHAPFSLYASWRSPKNRQNNGKVCPALLYG